MYAAVYTYLHRQDSFAVEVLDVSVDILDLLPLQVCTSICVYLCPAIGLSSFTYLHVIKQKSMQTTTHIIDECTYKQA